MRRGESTSPAFISPNRAACLLLVALSLLAAPKVAHAGACCLSAGVFGVGRLVIWEEAAFGTSFSTARVRGMWGADGEWQAYGDGYAETEGAADIYAIARLGERFQGYARLPWIYTQRTYGDVSELGHGLGDVQAGLRFEPIGIGEYAELPAVALTASVLAPTGTRPEDAATSFGTGTSGRGAWVLSLGLSIERAVIPWFVRLDVGGTLALPFHREDLDVDQTYGPGLQVALFGGREIIPDKWVVALGAIQEWEGPYELDGRTMPNSSARSPTVSLSTSWQLTPHWMVQASTLANVWANDLGKNRLGRLGGSIGVRYGYF